MDGSDEKSRGERLRETFSALLGEWRQLASRLVEEAEQFTREKPAAGLAAAFVAGFVLNSLFRRR